MDKAGQSGGYSSKKGGGLQNNTGDEGGYVRDCWFENQTYV